MALSANRGARLQQLPPEIALRSCSVTVDANGNISYDASIENLPEGDSSPQVIVEWVIYGQVVARDGPLTLGIPPQGGVFRQPRDSFTEEGMIDVETMADARARFGLGDHAVELQASVV